jgi:taurine dioxygenase
LDVDLADELGGETIAAIRRARLDHLVIFFRGQDLPPARFLALARRFGEPVEYPFVTGVDGFPPITPVIKLEHERVNFGGLWHSDTAYLEIPPMGTMLIAREVPPHGGDTIFANMYLAYEALPLISIAAPILAKKSRCEGGREVTGVQARGGSRSAIGW